MKLVLSFGFFLLVSLILDKGFAAEDIPHGTVSKSGVSDIEKQKIQDLHNAFRRVVAVNATNMMKLVWDDDIAKAAQRHAEKCSTEHDDLANRWTSALPGVYIGQNMCVGKNSWETCIRAWVDEKADFSYGFGSKTPDFHKIGHFTQLMNWHSSRIGCGYAECSDTVDKTFFVCNYGYGQYYHDIHSPWKTGSSCTDCPQNCDKRLCDCGGKICKNYGMIDLKTCTCNCLPHYSGSQCETHAQPESHVNCSVQDDSTCAFHSKDECTSGVNIVSLCPHFCGRC